MWKYSKYYQIKIMAAILSDVNINLDEVSGLIRQIYASVM
jgi:hypothetical protein